MSGLEMPGKDGGLEMPKRGESARLLQELNAQHAPVPQAEEDRTNERYNVTTLKGTPEATGEPTNETSNAETKERTGEATNGRRKNSSGGRTKSAMEKVGARPDAATPTAAVSTPIPTAEEERYAAALDRAREDAVAVVTVRAPERFNTYIDRYVERLNRVSPKAKYRKQDAVAEMFAWFYASHPMPPAPADEDDL